jgi:hypothetical protein
LDLKYGTLAGASAASFYGLQFPSGENYAPETYDDITNFSSGTLEDSIPQ